jgi:hypothetical protein
VLEAPARSGQGRFKGICSNYDSGEKPGLASKSIPESRTQK